jgi:acetyl/propionyl-CoA carboxylase alpha subunit
MLRNIILVLFIYLLFLEPTSLFSEEKNDTIKKEKMLIQKYLKEIKKEEKKNKYLYKKTQNELSKIINLYIFLESKERKSLGRERISNKYLTKKLMEYNLKLYQNLKINLSKAEENKQLLYAKLTKLKEIYAERKEKNISEGRTSKVEIMDSIILNPITLEKTKEGQHRIVLKEKRKVYAPISGIVDKITFTQGVLSLKIKNEKCLSSVWGLSILSVSPGQNVKLGEIIGETEEPLGKDFQFVYEVFCHR